MSVIHKDINIDAMENLSRRSFLHKMGIRAGTSALAFTIPHSLSFASANIKPYDGRKLNIALCGLGRYAGYLADSFQDTQYCRLAGLVTGTPAKGEEWGKKYGVPKANIYNYQNFDTIARNKDI